MKEKKTTHKIEDEFVIKNNIVYCTECGDELSMFGISGGSVDLKKIKERHKRCIDNGKFKGDKCAMLFIAEESEYGATPPEDE
jgi:hypothetical protein